MLLTLNITCGLQKFPKLDDGSVGITFVNDLSQQKELRSVT
jgi:hypothetical protein